MAEALGSIDPSLTPASVGHARELSGLPPETAAEVMREAHEATNVTVTEALSPFGDTATAPSPAWAAATAAHRAWLAASGASAGTIRLHRHYLRHLARIVGPDPWAATEDDLVAFLADHTWKPETRKSARSTVRSFYKWAQRTGRVDCDPSQWLPPIRVLAPVPKPAPEDVVASALAQSQPRERLMVLLGATAGLRIAEIAALHTDDLLQRPDGLWLWVRGKGDKTRVVPVSAQLAGELLGLPRPGWIFPARGDTNGHLTAGHVGMLLKRALGGRLSAHTLRHRFATVVYAGGRDLLATQQLLGHSRPETTARYTALPNGALRAGAANAATIG